MDNEMELIITDADLERMQAEVDEAIKLQEEEEMELGEATPGRVKSA